MAPHPKIVVVAYPVGRVGSSAMMGLLRTAGVNVGAKDRLSQPGWMNPRGFFELPAQEEFLRRVYASIYPHISLPPPLDVLERVGRQYAGEYLELLTRELGGRFPMGVKSQWFLTLPFLNELREQYDVRVLVMDRKREDQVRSLLRVFERTDSPILKSATPEFVAIYIQAWRELGAEILRFYEFRSLPISFDTLLAQPLETMERISAFLDIPCPPEDQITDWLDPALVNPEALSLTEDRDPPVVSPRSEESPEGRSGSQPDRRQPSSGPRLSVVVNTLNEERNLEDCLESVRGVADEIVVVDMHSEDRTVEIARRFTDRIYAHERTGVVEPAREFAIQQATGDWILVLDADERVSPELARGLREVIRRPQGVAVFCIPRRNYVAGRWMEGTGLGMDVERQPRLFRKGALRWPDRIHAYPTILGKKGPLPLPQEARIDHLAYRDLHQFVERLNRYTDHESQALKDEGTLWSLDRMLEAARDEIEKRYDPETDGVHSLVLSVFMAFYRFLAWAKLWEEEGYPRAALPETASDLLRAFADQEPVGPRIP